MKHLLISFTLLVTLSFHSQAQKKVELPSDWKLISGCTVGIYVPSDIEFVEDNSSDTCLREYRNKNISVQLYVTPFNIGADVYSNWIEYCVIKTKINTRDAEIVTQQIPITSEKYYGLDYMAMMLVPQFRKGSGNLIITTWSKTSEDRDKAIKILRSVQFDKK
jgi:hypothetical protein